MVRICLLAAALLLAAPAARAGGDFVDLAVDGSTVWFVGSFGVRGIDTDSGRIEAEPQLARASYPLSVAAVDGAVWVASVENGFVAGKLTRIDLRTGRARVVLRTAGSVQALAPGAGGVYALVASLSRNTIALLSPSGHLVRNWVVADPGRMAADASGCWVSAGGGLVHIDPAGRVRRVLRAPIGDVATGDGAVWLPVERGILRVDERTGQVRTLHTGALHLGGFQHDVAVGAGALWTLDTLTPALQERDLLTGRLLRTTRVPAIPDAVVPTASGIWVGIAEKHLALRFDRRTLRRTLTVHAD
jgi:hypothetical protein